MPGEAIDRNLLSDTDQAAYLVLRQHPKCLDIVEVLSLTGYMALAQACQWYGGTPQAARRAIEQHVIATGHAAKFDFGSGKCLRVTAQGARIGTGNPEVVDGKPMPEREDEILIAFARVEHWLHGHDLLGQDGPSLDTFRQINWTGSEARRLKDLAYDLDRQARCANGERASAWTVKNRCRADLEEAQATLMRERQHIRFSVIIEVVLGLAAVPAAIWLKQAGFPLPAWAWYVVLFLFSVLMACTWFFGERAVVRLEQQVALAAKHDKNAADKLAAVEGELEKVHRPQTEVEARRRELPPGAEYWPTYGLDDFLMSLPKRRGVYCTAADLPDDNWDPVVTFWVVDTRQSLDSYVKRLERLRHTSKRLHPGSRFHLQVISESDQRGHDLYAVLRAAAKRLGLHFSRSEHGNMESEDGNTITVYDYRLIRYLVRAICH